MVHKDEDEGVLYEDEDGNVVYKDEDKEKEDENQEISRGKICTCLLCYGMFQVINFLPIAIQKHYLCPIVSNVHGYTSNF